MATRRPGGFRLRGVVRRAVIRLRGEEDDAARAAHGLRLGRNVYIGAGVYVDPGFLWLISIGDDSTITSGTRIIAHDASIKRHLGYTAVARVEIGSRVYIGMGATILPGVSVGDDAIVGAASVVHDDVPAGMVAVGNPARVVGTVADHVARHAARLESAPVFEGEGWSRVSGITEERMAVMLRRLGSGIGYVP
jgi:maltose O-acetyltransferase